MKALMLLVISFAVSCGSLQFEEEGGALVTHSSGNNANDYSENKKKKILVVNASDLDKLEDKTPPRKTQFDQCKYFIATGDPTVDTLQAKAFSLSEAKEVASLLKEAKEAEGQSNFELQNSLLSEVANISAAVSNEYNSLCGDLDLQTSPRLEPL